jgi:hypothetical protein
MITVTLSMSVPARGWGRLAAPRGDETRHSSKETEDLYGAVESPVLKLTKGVLVVSPNSAGTPNTPQTLRQIAIKATA